MPVALFWVVWRVLDEVKASVQAKRYSDCRPSPGTGKMPRVEESTCHEEAGWIYSQQRALHGLSGACSMSRRAATRPRIPGPMVGGGGGNGIP